MGAITGSQGSYEPAYTVDNKKSKSSSSSSVAASGQYTVYGKKGKAPSAACSPVETTIWSHSIVVWDRADKMLTKTGRKLCKWVSSDLL